jgi:sulfoxide reductase catalytic subunit YedY
MSNIIIPPAWSIPEHEVTPESFYLNRRRFLRTLGLGAALMGCANGSRGSSKERMRIDIDPNRNLYPAPRNNKYTVDRALTEETITGHYNNFYEFSGDKEQVAERVGDFEIRPWDIEITGLVQRPVKLTVDELMRRLPLEERVYRHRCVEAWAMTVPWTGIPLAKVLDLAAPLSSATHVRFISFLKPEEAPNQKSEAGYTWPYYEALRIEEATNELAMAVVGIYGHGLPRQNGAPIRIVTPWKYGYKSAKSIVRIELVSSQPKTFWNDAAPDEYGFLANVNPAVPHPRWSQETELLIGENRVIPTLPFNGYGRFVASMYA